MGGEKTGKEGKPERRYDIDWLRVVAMLAVFLYHCARFFGPEGWHLKNTELSEIVLILRVSLIWVWVMELFFLLSGFGTWYALKSRTSRQYLIERGKRLLIPLYTVGLFILIPPQFYFEIVTNGGYTGTFWGMIPRYFGAFGSFGLSSTPFTLLPFPFGGHLWFLQYLFLISLLILPPLLYIKSESGQNLISKLAGWSHSRGGIFLFIIPIALIQIILRSVFEGRFTWADFIYYAVFFIIGYMMAADNRFTESIKRRLWIYLSLWFAGFGGMAYLITALGYDPFSGGASSSLIFVLFQIVATITTWSAVIFMLSMGARYMNFNNRVLTYANEAVLPFYIFHQTVILSVGWLVLPWNIGILPKYLIIALVSFSLIMIMYELFVRRFNVVRFFFGMRPRKTS